MRRGAGAAFQAGAEAPGVLHPGRERVSSAPAGGGKYHSDWEGGKLRIVSLLAAATEMVCALGAGEMLAGRSHECDHPEWVRGLPRCSEPAFDVTMPSGAIDREVRRRIAAGEELYRIDADLIRRLRPDLVIAQAHCAVCAVTPGDLEKSGDCFPTLTLSAATVEDIFAGIAQTGARLGREERADEVVRRERARLGAVRERTKSRRRPGVAVLEWTDPLFATGNWGPELIEIAGGEAVFGRKGEYSKALTAEELVAADPEFLIVAPCGFGLGRALGEREVLERNGWWAGLRAVREGKVAYADGNLYFNRAGMTIAPTAEMIAEILHGETFGAPMAGRAWVKAGGDRA